MREFCNAFWRWFVVFFVLAFIFVRLMESAGYFDSIGIWYSVYSAAGIALPIAAVFAIFGGSLLSTWWHLRR
jgi:hypothetical protein